MIDLLCTKYLRVNVKLLAVKGIDAKVKENVRSSASVCSGSIQSTTTTNITKTKSAITSPFKKSLLASLFKKDNVTNDISVYATFSSTGILGIEEQNMLVSSNVVDENTNEVKKVIYWERENKIVHNDVIEDNNVENKDNDDKGAPTVSIPIVLMKDKRTSEESTPIHKKKKLLQCNLTEEIINIDLGLISSFNNAENKMEKIHLGRASFVVSEEACGSHTMSIPIRCNDKSARHANLISSLQKSMLKKLKSPSSKNATFLSSTKTKKSFRGERSREFSLSPNAVLQLFVDISYTDESFAVEDEILSKSYSSPSKSFIKRKKENYIIEKSGDNSSDQVNNKKACITVTCKAGESSGIIQTKTPQKQKSVKVKQPRNQEQSWYDAVFDELLINILQSCNKLGANCDELLCHEPNYDNVHGTETMSSVNDEETRTFFTEDDTFLTQDKKHSMDETCDYTYDT